MWGSSITFEDYPLEHCMGLMAELGFTRVEMWKHHLRRCRTPELQRAFGNYAGTLGIEMGGLNVVGEDYFRPFGTEHDKRFTLSELCNDMDLAVSIGAKELLIWEGRRPRGLSTIECRQKLLPQLTELLQDALTNAKARGLKILVEPHPFTVGMDDEFLVALCDGLDSDLFGITFDFCHYGVGRPHDYIKAVHNLGHRIRHLHFSDSDQQTSELHFAPGEGSMDIAGLLQAFKDIGYRSTLTLDLYGNPCPIDAARRSRTRVDAACATLGLGSGTMNSTGTR
jgi:sugar phosphate isomerase/epimerase